MELYESLTTKQLKRKHSSGLVGGEEMGSQGEEDWWQGGGWRTWAGKVAACGLDEVVADRPGSPTFACK